MKFSTLLTAMLGFTWPLIAQVGAIVPTVTVEGGDTGGKLFGQVPDPGKTRHYYIAAEPVQWDYAPIGSDPVCGKPLPPPLQGNQKVGKLRYVQYTDATFGSKVFETERLGILGPVLRGVVGETLAVTFLNRTAQPLSMHPHGVHYDKDNEGSWYQPSPGLGAAIAPGARFTYMWQLDEDSGPMPEEPSSKGWLYHSHVTGESEINQGLVGFLIVTDPKRARPDGTPADVDREMASLFMIFDESGLDADAIEALEYINDTEGPKPEVKSWTEIQQMLQAGARATINGRVFGNLKGLEMNEGERVRWYLFGLGSQEDFHTAHWHGARVTEDGRRRSDVVDLLPASMKVADLRADSPGTWMHHCHVADHMMEGMYSAYTVHPKSDPKASREPSIAFFGATMQDSSLALRSTQMKGDDLIINGTVTVFEAISLYTQAIQVNLGKRTHTLQTQRDGVGKAEGCTFRARNVTPLGIIFGGLLEFELTLTDIGEVENSTKLHLKIGEAAHAATLPVRRESL